MSRLSSFSMKQYRLKLFEINQKLNIAVNCFIDKEINLGFIFVLSAFPLYISCLSFGTLAHKPLRPLRLALRTLQLALRALWQARGWTNGWTDGQMEFLPILQDFVPSRGRCPATLWDFITAKKQGKGITSGVREQFAQGRQNPIWDQQNSLWDKLWQLFFFIYRN